MAAARSASTETRAAVILRARRFVVAPRPRWALIIVLSSLVSTCAQAPTSVPTVHRFAGGPDEMYANAYIIEGESGVVVVDALLTRTASRELRDRVDAIGKPLQAVVVTHGHPDHYGGITQLVDGLDDVTVAAVRGVDRVIRRDDALKGRRLAAFGIDWAETRTFANVVVEDGQRLSFGEITLTPVDIGEGESHHDSAWILSTADGDHAFVGDLVMEGVHAYTADGHTGAWLGALRGLEHRLRSVVRIYPGHGEPAGPELLGIQATYLEAFREEVRDLAAGRPRLTEQQAAELQRRMVEVSGHDRVARWILEGADPVAGELSAAAER